VSPRQLSILHPSPHHTPDFAAAAAAAASSTTLSIPFLHPQIMKNHKKGMTMAHVLQQGLWGEGILHSEHL